MVLKPVGTQNTPKKQYNMDTRIAKNPPEIPRLHVYGKSPVPC